VSLLDSPEKTGGKRRDKNCMLPAPGFAVQTTYTLLLNRESATST
jgi:hypothetical protein